MPSERQVQTVKHTLKISVSKEPRLGGIVGYHKVTMRERLFRLLLGRQRKLMVIVPGDSVKTLSIVEEGGEKHG